MLKTRSHTRIWLAGEANRTGIPRELKSRHGAERLGIGHVLIESANDLAYSGERSPPAATAGYAGLPAWKDSWTQASASCLSCTYRGTFGRDTTADLGGS